MIILPKFSILFCTLFIVILPLCFGTDSTTQQLRESVYFSHYIANYFLDLIRGNAGIERLPEIAINLRNAWTSRISFSYLQPLLTSYAGYITCLIIGLVFAILMPLVGLVFCCCRCCGRCGGQVKHMDAKRDPYRRVCYTIFLSIITTIQLAAIVLVFINCHLQHVAIISEDEAIGTIPQLNASLIEAEVAIDEMLAMAKNASTIDLTPQKKQFDKIIFTGLMDFQEDFIKNSTAQSVIDKIGTLKSVVMKYGPTSSQRMQIYEFDDDLTALEAKLRQWRGIITDQLDSGCTESQLRSCMNLQNTARKLIIRASPTQYQLTDAKELLTQLEAPNTEGLDEVNKTLNSIANTVHAKIEPKLSAAWRNLAKSSTTRTEMVNRIQNVSDKLKLAHRTNWDGTYEIHQGFEDYVFYGCIALLCFPVLIILFIYLGLCFGICGDRPYEDAGLCNRGVGANLLMAAVAFIFLFSSLLMIVCTILFLVGGPVQTEFCRYATGWYPNGPQVLDECLEGFVRAFTENHLNLGMPPETLKYLSKLRAVEGIMVRCANESFVDSLGSEYIARQLSDDSTLGVVNEIVNAFDHVDLIQPLRSDILIVRRTLDDMLLPVTFDFTTAIEQYNQPLTQIDNIQQYLNDLAKLEISGLDRTIQEMRTDLVTMEARLPFIQQTMIELDKIENLMESLKTALSKFESELRDVIPQKLNIGVQRIRPLFVRELRMAIVATWREIPCKALHEAAVTGVNSVCVTLLYPFNGLWMGLGLCLLLFIPGLICAVKLANLYRKTEKYSSDYEEPDYLSYHGFYMRSPEVEIQQPHKRKGKNKKAGWHQLPPYQTVPTHES